MQALRQPPSSLLARALQFQLGHPGVSTITVGMKTRRQVEETVNALNEKLHDNPFDYFVAV